MQIYVSMAKEKIKAALLYPKGAYRKVIIPELITAFSSVYRGLNFKYF